MSREVLGALCRALGALLLVPGLVTAQRPTLSAAVKQYVAVDTPVVALTTCGSSMAPAPRPRKTRR